MNEMVTRIRKETKAKLKEVVKEASRRLDVDTDQLFEQALHTIVRHYDSVAPGRSSDLNFPAPAAEGAASETPAATPSRKPSAGKASAPRKAAAKSEAPSAEATPAKRASRSAPKATPATTRTPSRIKRSAAPAPSTPEATNDSVAADNV
jgi:hypothetical protein